MITLQQFAEYFQNRLNAALNSNEVEFIVWADAGKYQKAIRSGNTVHCKIHGLLAVSAGANDANNVISIGVNGLALNFLIPLYTPRTNTKQTEQDLQPVQDNGYVFAARMRNIVDNFFQQAQTTFMTDAQGVRYSVSYKAGMAATGEAAIRPGIGNSIEYSAYIEVTFAEGGISSKAVSVSIDGNPVPFQSVRFGRALVSERNVYSGSNNSTVFASSTAFSIDVDFPATENGAPQTALDYILNGEPNTAHFVSVQWTESLTKTYFMAVQTAQNTAMGTSIMGVSAAFAELAGNPSLYSVPKTFGLYKFKFSKSTVDDGSIKSLTLRCGYPRMYYIAGNPVGETEPTPDAIDMDIPLTESAFEWSEEDGLYYVTLVTINPILIFRSNSEGLITVQG